jgi:hypothetical protein
MSTWLWQKVGFDLTLRHTMPVCVGRRHNGAGLALAGLDGCLLREENLNGNKHSGAFG